MKTKLKLLLLAIGLLLAVTACEEEGNSSKLTTLGGDTNLEINKVGSSIGGPLKLNGSTASNDGKLEVISNENGIITIRATMTLPAKLKNLVEQKFIDSKGKLNVTMKIKNSTEGIAYYNSENKQSIIVKYDQKVGDKWSYTTQGGKKIERKVIHKSEENDFPFGFYNIKVIKVEQNLPYAGFSKILFRANHKFGLVNMEMFLEDGDNLSMTLL